MRGNTIKVQFPTENTESEMDHTIIGFTRDCDVHR
jgi:hypothetical protein